MVGVETCSVHTLRAVAGIAADGGRNMSSGISWMTMFISPSIAVLERSTIDFHKEAW